MWFIIRSASRVIWEESDDRFNVLPLRVATDGVCSVMSADAKNEHFHKRVVGLAEREWPAHIFKIGDVLIGV